MKYITRNYFAVPLTSAISSAGNPVGQRVANVVVDEDDACRWRITLASLVPFGIEGFTAPQWGTIGVKALITWGGASGKFFAAVDWNPLGCSLAVTGHDITVDVVAPTDMVIPAGVVPRAFATIVPCGGAKESVTRPTFSRRINFGAPASVVQDCPPFARAVRWWCRTAGAAVGVGLRFFDDAAAASVRYQGAAGNFLADRYTTLVGNSEQFSFDEVRIPAFAAFTEWTVSAAVTLQTEYELDIG